MPTTGCVWANVQNKHAAPGICTFSGDSLFRLYRYTKDTFCLDLCRDIAHAIPNFVCRPDRLIPTREGLTLGSGWINERVNMSDWEGKQSIGEVFYGSCWPETSLALTYAQLPGIYIDMAARRIWVLDHVSAKLTEEERGLSLSIENPTAYDAQVKCFAESGNGSIIQKILKIKSHAKITVYLE